MDLSGHEPDIPIPITSTYAHGHTLIHDPPPLHSPNGPLPPVIVPDNHHHHLNNDNHHHTSCSKKGVEVVVVVRYRECLKNHAATIGGHALDGCGEFMPSGEDGSLEALKCSACHCHRNFHRKEVEGGTHCPSPSDFYYHHQRQQHFLGEARKVVGQKGVLISTGNNNSLVPRPSPTHHHMIMPVGAAVLQQTSESDEMEAVRGGGGGMYHYSRAPMVKKRFRTKFTPEQKEKMLAFAERVGWRLQRREEGEVQQFCQEIGVRRRVLKVWMHNNKHSLAKNNNQVQLE